jgi:3-oxoacyl-[acyl-carrier protein] reductase
MKLGIEGKHALVTGASAGLGEAAATALAAENASVTICSRSADRLKQAVDRIERATGNRPEYVEADISTPEGVQGLGEALSGRAVDILVSNTGGPPAGQFLDVEPDQWDRGYRLILDSAVRLTRMVLPGMIEREWGRLIYITSVSVFQPIDNLMLSNSFRAGVTGFVKTISNNYARHGVTANTVCPGYTDTARLRELAEKAAENSPQSADEILQGFGKDTPVGRIGKPEELAALIAFLASVHAANITGASIPVDGGHHKFLL